MACSVVQIVNTQDTVFSPSASESYTCSGDQRWDRPDLKEFIYRFNRRWNEDKLFYYLTRRAVEATPFPYHRLIAEPIG